MKCSHSSGCNRPQAPSHRYCREHRNEAQRRYRAEAGALSPDEADKARCRAYTGVLVRRGVLTKEPCRDCGTTEHVEAHHPDYSNPRLVIWLCRLHHRQTHRDVWANEVEKIRAAFAEC